MSPNIDEQSLLPALSDLVGDEAMLYSFGVKGAENGDDRHRAKRSVIAAP
jgi:hypothetical protein